MDTVIQTNLYPALQALAATISEAHILVLPALSLAATGAVVLLLMVWQKNRRLKSIINEKEKELECLNQQVSSLNTSAAQHKVRETRLVTLLQAERRTSSEKLRLLEDAREDLRLQFSSLAQDIFEKKNRTFTTLSKERLEALLQPFQHHLDALQREMRETYQSDTRERASLKKELHQLQEMNRQMSEEALNLTRALKGDKKLQGAWGELILERVLEHSGLRKGVEYETQRGLRNEENILFKPDVLIHLPEGKTVIIDSKVSLVGWERYCNTEDDGLRQQALTELVTAIRNHITSLGQKNYEELRGIRCLDFILMFMPVEAAFISAFDHDDTLFTEAFKNKIVVVTPTTLIATLRTIESIWRYEHQSRNAQEIARKAGNMYDKFRGFIEDMEKIGKQLESCQLTYEAAMTKLCNGRGNLVSQAMQLTELGIQVKKELPHAVTERAQAADKN